MGRGSIQLGGGRPGCPSARVLGGYVALLTIVLHPAARGGRAEDRSGHLATPDRPTSSPSIDRQSSILLAARGSAAAGSRAQLEMLPATSASSPVSQAMFADLLERLDQQDRIIRDLQRQIDNERLPHVVPAAPASLAPAAGRADKPACCCPKPEEVYAPLVGDADDGKCPACGGQKKLKKRHIVTHRVGYDKGFVVKPFNASEYPFSLKFNGRIQFRYHGFARDNETWTDHAGVTRPIRNRSAFDVERARLLLSGTVLDPRLSFFLQMDGDSDGRHQVDFFDYWWAWKFSDLLQIQMGKRKVSGSRQWLIGAFDTMFVDRAMATDFFRPDRTLGVWFRGDLTERMHYEIMVGNGYRTTNLPLSQQNDKFGYAFTQWIDLGEADFGKTFADYEYHAAPAVQLGHSFTASEQDDTLDGVPLAESDFVRLSDGTVLDSPNALAPGTRVTDFDIFMYSVDAAWKYAGWSINGEYFFRWLESIGGVGTIPVTEIFDRGFYVQASVYLIPKKVYVAGRVSQVKGPFGDHYEYAGAINWFPGSDRNLKVTVDVTTLDGSPLNNTTSDILVGDDGLLVRTQFQGRF